MVKLAQALKPRISEPKVLNPKVLEPKVKNAKVFQPKSLQQVVKPSINKLPELKTPPTAQFQLISDRTEKQNKQNNKSTNE